MLHSLLMKGLCAALLILLAVRIGLENIVCSAAEHGLLKGVASG